MKEEPADIVSSNRLTKTVLLAFVNVEDPWNFCISNVSGTGESTVSSKKNNLQEFINIYRNHSNVKSVKHPTTRL
jgi:hypothetical protein